MQFDSIADRIELKVFQLFFFWAAAVRAATL